MCMRPSASGLLGSEANAQGAKAGNETVDVDFSCACLACSLRAHHNALCS